MHRGTVRHKHWTRVSSQWCDAHAHITATSLQRMGTQCIDPEGLLLLPEAPHASRHAPLGLYHRRGRSACSAGVHPRRRLWRIVHRRAAGPAAVATEHEASGESKGAATVVGGGGMHEIDLQRHACSGRTAQSPQAANAWGATL
jgi:hypothetical protein